MPRASRRVFTRGLAALASVAVVASVAVAVTTVGDDVVVCPPGTVPNTGVEPRIVAPDQRDQLPLGRWLFLARSRRRRVCFDALFFLFFLDT